MKFSFMQNPLTQIPFFAWIYNSFINSHLLEWLKVRQIKSGIRVNFDQCEENDDELQLKSSAIPTELSGLVTDYGNILLYLLIHYQTKHMKSNKYTIYHEIYIYAKSLHPNSVFCLNLEFFYHFPPSRMVESPPD